MERDQNAIKFDQSEQEEFNVPPLVDVALALQTASAFDDAANKLRSQAEQITASSEDSDSQVLVHTRYLNMRATRLASFASGIVEAAFSETPKN